MHDVGGKLYDTTPTGTFGGESFFDIAEDLGALDIEIANSDGVAVLVGGPRSGDEEKLRSLDPRYLLILSQRRAERIGIIYLDISGHDLSSS